MKKQKGKEIRFGLGQKIITCILAMQIVIMGALSALVVYNTTGSTKESSINNMETITQERAQIVKNYVVETESTLTAYSRAGEIRNLLENPKDAKAVEAAQKYTEVFSGDVANLEGLYTSDWNTHVVSHTNSAVVGITTREGDSLKTLQDALLSTDGVYNTGIIISPASQQQIVSLYRAIYGGDGEPIGIVGGGIFTKGLIETLNELKINGAKNAKYSMVNAKDGKYVFVNNTEKVGMVAEEQHIQKLCKDLSSSKKDVCGYVEYKEGNNSYISTYYYLADYGWIFQIDTAEKEIFVNTNSLMKLLILFSVIALIVMCLISIIVIKKLMQPMKPIEGSILDLQDYDITEKQQIHKYAKRGDELGNITKATESLVYSLQDIIGTLQDCCENLDGKADNLHVSSADLIASVTDNMATAEEFSASMENTNLIVQNTNDEIGKISDTVQDVLHNISVSVTASNEVISSAQSMKGQAGNAYENGQETLERTMVSVHEALSSLKIMENIREMASEIMNIAGQTNLLSLNASIEAARAGESGRGFAVVAEEIGNLADTSSSTASAIQELCAEADKSMDIVNSCFTSIISFIEQEVVEQFKDFVDQSSSYCQEVDSIKKQLDSAENEVKQLYQFVLQISDNIENVKTITDQNQAAIDTIVEKNESTSVIANLIQKQSEENRELANQLEKMIVKFRR
ncbi:MAG: methyl-accepting chemotaxis protein [Lachnospiraceae bacterium]|nr:methyl-accepting chemotaxis protein [Lachnospiraceae bacterium]